MIWWLVILWFIVVGVPAVYVAVKGAKTARRAQALQTEIQAHVTALQQGGLLTLASKQAELQAALEKLTVAMNRLSKSLETLRLLIERTRNAVMPLRLLYRFLRA